MRLEPRPLGPDDRSPPLQLPEQPLAIPSGHVRHEQHARVLVVVPARRIGRHRESAGVQQSEHRPQLTFGEQHRRQGPRRMPFGAPRCRDQIGLLAAAHEQRRQPLAIALASPTCRCQLISVARDARRGQCVDIGEHQLRERPQRRRRDPARDRFPRQSAPTDSRPDPVCRLQGIHRPATSRLPPPQLVCRGRARRDRLGGVGPAPQPGKLKEVDQGQLDRGPDPRAHDIGKRPGIARHFAHDRLDRFGGDPRDDGPQAFDHVLVQGEVGLGSGRYRGGSGHGIPPLSLANKSSGSLHVEPSEI
jgi:hypothetical protein